MRWWHAAVHTGIAVIGLVFALTTEDLDRFYRWDEAVYASQFSAVVEPAGWGPQRSPGMAYLVAPVTLLTDSAFALRLWVATLGSITCALGFWIWSCSIGIAGAAGHGLFIASGLVVVYTTEIYPNIWLAHAGLITVGLAVGPWKSRRWMAALAMAACVAGAFRPAEAFVVVAVAVIALFATHRRGAVAPAFGTAIGYIVGVMPWVARSFFSFGGPLDRLRGASNAAGPSGELRLREALLMLDNPYGGQAVNEMLATAVVLWLGGILFAACLAIFQTHSWRHPVTSALVGALALASPFLLKSDPAPRFFLPALALLCVAAGVGLVVRLPRRNVQVVAAIVIAVLAALQYTAYEGARDRDSILRERLETAAAALVEVTSDVVGDCSIITNQAVPQMESASGCVALPKANPKEAVARGLHHEALSTGQRIFALARSEDEIPEGWTTHAFEVDFFNRSGATWFIAEISLSPQRCDTSGSWQLGSPGGPGCVGTTGETPVSEWS